jgi:lysophospholipase L1-like esterase
LPTGGYQPVGGSSNNGSAGRGAGRTGAGGGRAPGGTIATGGGTPATGGSADTGGKKSSGGNGALGGHGGTTYPVSAGKPTVYLAGDSTVQTYSESQAPQQGWGQRLGEFFTSDVIIVNKAMGGRSSKSYVTDGRLDEIVKLLKLGDYLFAQWGINDRYQSDTDRYTDPATTFRTYLKMYIDGARGKNAIPVLITPTPRLDYVDGVFKNDFPDYCKAIKEVGAETHTPVIDLQTKGLEYYTSIGYDEVQSKISLDVLHFKTEGAHQMARLVAEGVQEIGVPISQYVK